MLLRFHRVTRGNKLRDVLDVIDVGHIEIVGGVVQDAVYERVRGYLRSLRCHVEDGDTPRNPQSDITCGARIVDANISRSSLVVIGKCSCLTGNVQ